ncbi:MAG: hypothetical protein A3C08_00390 [Candidatus Taylorbacteria bacterium RIFCSPHIGHO2_02_FULL_47_18]|uniref:Uncharacterized protein n=1 Tax=Candidatus Taylorbacteria bacterium RIFCSPLOWO2_01_FULL_48_100 TaxID=1802322 RepID=A0A1G2NEV9_9BACT|nr:MAG: hypothetical protein A2670_00105 [Candidatus Taylorbacteria bacterium RIFCSPHIGHO2_01_FULL_48_38]OHA27819.1 MAG: hypothetical protein A3C08_00390 [Candidatus Taylorbacteria bacterium RIFCSPHIGHO2_02_FULL_47_18]OHA33931.1 MAG: hypothetical protein A2938_02830 [Candidatus Taylorbacteria bacterium RIFCSPLOWO2_01_FULL_48_100]OHA40905.1 MAG: hypothetical protein A3J31_03835 [Candidatus Taylorbacteria bacterium RIFCSPLOWO2_02_FULL_48_16]OHA45083.1 MAG: hypothetical protein A3H13_02740 [Candid
MCDGFQHREALLRLGHKFVALPVLFGESGNPFDQFGLLVRGVHFFAFLFVFVVASSATRRGGGFTSSQRRG